MPKKYDTLELKIQQIDAWNHCVILINGIDILDIIKKSEKKLFRLNGLNPEEAGAYNYLIPSEFYEYLSCHDPFEDSDVYILCCSCGEARCASVRIKMEKILIVLYGKILEVFVMNGI